MNSQSTDYESVVLPLYYSSKLQLWVILSQVRVKDYKDNFMTQTYKHITRPLCNEIGYRGVTRTRNTQNQNLLPYHLATRQYK